MYVRVCQGKTHIYVLKHSQGKDKAKKLRYKVKIGCQAIRRQENSGYQRAMKGEKHSKPQNRRFNPQYGRQLCYEENHSMSWGKPQQTE
jgi:hypothetical protein